MELTHSVLFKLSLEIFIIRPVPRGDFETIKRTFAIDTAPIVTQLDNHKAGMALAAMLNMELARIICEVEKISL